MRLLLDTALNKGAAEYSNMGDVAMLQVAVTRLKKLWPSATIEVLTESPENLAVYCPGTKPTPRTGRDFWTNDHVLLGQYQELLPNWISSSLSRLVRTLRLRWPALLKSMVRLRLCFRDRQNLRDSLIAFMEATEQADAFLVCGAGGFADSERDWNLPVLGTLETALHRNIPVAMFGQGMGPLSDPLVLSKVERILPNVDLITLRGSRGGLALLASLGVQTSRMLTTGDDAIELAYDASPDEPGHGLGVNLRVATNSGIEDSLIGIVGPVLQKFARQRNVPLIPVPISFDSWSGDPETIRHLLAGFDDQSDGGATLQTPLKVIKQAGRCRVVVTGAYHAAVFALAQGIPAVCLAGNSYYAAKFLGLKDQFGIGCEIFSAHDTDLSKKLAAAIDFAWQSAGALRQPLRQAARRQIQLSWGAYERFRELVACKACKESAAALFGTSTN
jgi:polysaccharide pyruvyl transferase WcaK-like protein